MSLLHLSLFSGVSALHSFHICHFLCLPVAVEAVHVPSQMGYEKIRSRFAQMHGTTLTVNQIHTAY